MAQNNNDNVCINENGINNTKALASAWKAVEVAVTENKMKRKEFFN